MLIIGTHHAINCYYLVYYLCLRLFNILSVLFFLPFYDYNLLNDLIFSNRIHHYINNLLLLNSSFEGIIFISTKKMDATPKPKFMMKLSKIVGQATASNNFQPATKLCIAWNILYVVIYFFVLVWTLYSLPHKEDKFGYKGWLSNFSLNNSLQ